MKHFSGRVALVTGGASGIGYGIVRCLLREGMKVVVVDVNQEHLDEVRKELAGAGETHFVRADVSDRAQVRAAADEALRVFGKIHVLCNNVGVGGGGNVEDPDFEAWDRALAINIGGVVNGVKIVVPHILAHGEGGHVVNTASMSGIVPLPLPGLGAYSTSKFAVRGLTESLRLSLASHGIGVSGLFPGMTMTRIFDAARRDESNRNMLSPFLKDATDPLEIGAAVVRGIRNNTAYILTHAEFRDEVREISAGLDAAFPEQQVPWGRQAFEDHRRDIVKQLRALPVKD